ncbi:hypothetical protein EGI22_20025 [Lacihabitans sp. LS3-19]|nr:hypothetical protein [Lacihabitans sp. LS3-19]
MTFSEEKVEKFEKTTLIDEYEKAFGGNRVVKSGLRVRFTNPESFPRSLPLIQLEQKIGKQFSIIGSVAGGFSSGPGTQINASIEGRWYYTMKKDIQSQKKQQNITGNFLAFNVKSPENYSPFINGSKLIQVPFYPNTLMINGEKTYSIIWGKQLGNILEIGLKAGLKTINLKSWGYQPPFNYNSSGQKYFLSTHSQVGIGVFFPNGVRKNITCDFLKCNYDVKRIFKFNLNNSFYIEKNYQHLKFDGSFEQRIMNSSFSSNSSLQLFIYRTFQNQLIGYKDSTIIDANGENISGLFPLYSLNKQSEINANGSIAQQFRYYLPRIIKDNSKINKLNGYYFGSEYSYNIGPFPKAYILPTYSSSLGLSIGYQTLASKNSYIDISASFGKSWSTFKLFNGFENETKKEQKNYFNLSLKLGLAK